MKKLVDKRFGFTLIEMIAVVIVLSLIAIIVTPVINDVIDNNKEHAYNDQINGIIASAKVWASEHVGNLPGVDGESASVTLETLQNGGYAKSGLKNPKTDEEFISNLTKVVITNQNGILNYQVVFE